MKKLLAIALIALSIIGCKSEESNSSGSDGITNPSYFPIKVTPAEKYTLINSSFKFAVSSGVPPYSYSIDSGPGTIAQDGTFQAGPYTGNSYIRIKDSVNQSATARVYIQPTLSLGPKNLKMNVSSSSTLSTTGGVPPYSFYIISGAGFLSYNVFTASSVAGTVKIGVYDSLGNQDTVEITTNKPLSSSSPGTINLNRGESFTLTMQDGFPPYLYRVVSGPGAVSGNSGLYQASGGSGTALIEGYDSIGTKVYTTFFISSQPLSISPQEYTMEINREVQFKASGGLSPYTYSFIYLCGQQPVGEPCGTPIGHLLSSGLYFSPNESGKDIIRVQDSEGSVTYAEVNINPPLTVTPATKVTIVNRSEIFTAQGGVPPYNYTVISGNGIVNSTSGSFQSPATPGTSVIQIRDKAGSVVTATVTVNQLLAVVPNSSLENPAKTSVSNSLNIVASGGVPPYLYQIYQGVSLGSISNSGIFYAGSNSGNVVIRVVDALNSSLDVYINISSALTIVDPNFTLTAGASKLITATGGVPPYTIKFKDFTISPNGSTVTNGSSSMEYKSGFVTEMKYETIQVVDAIGNVAETVVTIDAGLRGLFEISKASGTGILSGNCNSYVQPKTPNAVNTWVNLITGQEPLLFRGCGDSPSSTFNFSPWQGTGAVGNPRSLVLFRKSQNNGDGLEKMGGTHVDLKLSATENPYTSVSVWFYWDHSTREGAGSGSAGTRLDGTIIGFDSYKLAFSSADITKNINKNYLCFMTDSDSNVTNNDCFGITDPDPIISSKWTHIVAMFNNSDVRLNKLYINGRGYQLQTLHDSGIVHILGRKTGSCTETGCISRASIGTTYYEPSEFPSIFKKITAKFGDIRFYNREITSAEILSLYNKDRGVYQAYPMSIFPSSFTVNRNASRDVIITGGTPPFQCRLKSGTGTVTPVNDTMVGSCTFTAANVTGTSIIEITDALNSKIESLVTIQ